MTRLSPDELCPTCGSLLLPPMMAFGMIVPSTADYVCITCRRSYRRLDDAPGVAAIGPVDVPKNDD